MRFNKIRKMDISNGPGVRVSVFTQGCDFHCENCFNPETHDFKGGKEFTENVLEQVLDLCDKDFIEGLSILGGDPLHPKNREGTTLLVKKFKERFPKKSVWVWTGFLFEQLKNEEIMNYIDVLVDGQYVDKLHDPTLRFCGSSNQRVIDIPNTLKKKEIVLSKLENKIAV